MWPKHLVNEKCAYYYDTVNLANLCELSVQMVHTETFPDMFF